MILTRRTCGLARRQWGGAGSSGGGPPPPWSPLDLAGLAFWAEMRAADLWQDTGKTSPVSVATDPARVMVARTPVVDLVAPSDAARPTWTDTGLGGGPGLIFDKTDDHLRSATAGTTGAQTWILRWAWGGTSSYRVIAGQQAAGLGHEVWQKSATLIQVHFGVNASVAGVQATVPSLGTGAHTTVITWDGVSSSATGSFTIYHDGALRALSAGDSLGRPTTTASRTTIGARNTDAANFFFDGKIGLVIVASGVLTGTDLASAIAYADGWTL